ncbi:MAG: GDSL-type esterase/lipase family protein [Candidatus Bathyarchaeota archaeon]|nr:GDSL-type esterase/lipase family protein [Candidatus Bathyarchaeota archaeon]
MDRKKFLTSVLVILLMLSGTVALMVLSTWKRKPASETIRVACVGDSLTQSTVYPYELRRLLGANYTVRNFGVGSTTVLLNTDTAYMNTSMFQKALEFQPNIVIIMLGTNDAQPNLEVFNASFVGDYVKLVAAFQELLSNPRIWAVLPPPIFSNQSGKIDPQYFELTLIPNIKQAANETDVLLIDVYSALTNYSEDFPDGVHPNDAAAKIIANTIYETLILNL